MGRPHLYKSACPSVGAFVGWSVSNAFVKIAEIRLIIGSYKEEGRSNAEEGVMRRKEHQGGRSNEDGEEGVARGLEKK